MLSDRERARARAQERAKIALLTDPDLSRYLGRAAANCDVVAYRAAWHEAVIVRGAPGVPSPRAVL